MAVTLTVSAAAFSAGGKPTDLDRLPSCMSDAVASLPVVVVALTASTAPRAVLALLASSRNVVVVVNKCSSIQLESCRACSSRVRRRRLDDDDCSADCLRPVVFQCVSFHPKIKMGIIKKTAHTVYMSRTGIWTRKARLAVASVLSRIVYKSMLRSACEAVAVVIAVVVATAALAFVLLLLRPKPGVYRRIKVDKEYEEEEDDDGVVEDEDAPRAFNPDDGDAICRPWRLCVAASPRSLTLSSSMVGMVCRAGRRRSTRQERQVLLVGSNPPLRSIFVVLCKTRVRGISRVAQVSQRLESRYDSICWVAFSGLTMEIAATSTIMTNSSIQPP